jgi:SAM-dependent methyltransferase
VPPRWQRDLVNIRDCRFEPLTDPSVPHYNLHRDIAGVLLKVSVSVAFRGARQQQVVPKVLDFRDSGFWYSDLYARSASLPSPTYDRSAWAAVLTSLCRRLIKMQTTTNKGLRGFVAERVLARYAVPGIRAADFGSGRGAIAERLHSFGCELVAVDRTAEGFEAGLPHVSLDFDQNDFASELSPASFDLVTAIEVIEHVESPIGFLRNIGRLLAPRGVAVITTPNVDSLPARAKFLLTGKIRTMDETSEPTHISPHFLGLASAAISYPGGSTLARTLPGDSILGDNHILVLEASQ